MSWVLFVQIVVLATWVTLMVDYALSKVHERKANLAIAMLQNEEEVRRGRK